jgi:hypothetical protein
MNDCKHGKLMYVPKTTVQFIKDIHTDLGTTSNVDAFKIMEKLANEGKKNIKKFFPQR